MMLIFSIIHTKKYNICKKTECLEDVYEIIGIIRDYRGNYKGNLLLSEQHFRK